jgi:UrcA family protein
MLNRSIPVLVAAACVAAAGYAAAQPYADPYSGNGPPARDYGYDRGPTVNELVITGHAPPGAQVQSRRVYFGDLDLYQDSGAYTLLNRIHGAAVQVCSPQPTTPGDLRDMSDYQVCVADAVGRAVEDVGAPSVTGMYRASYRWDR